MYHRLNNLERLANGNPARRKYRKEFRVYARLPKPPANMSDGAKVIWKKLGKQLVEAGIVKHLDETHFAHYVESLDELDEMLSTLKVQGRFRPDGTPNPLMAEIDRKRKAVSFLGSKFGVNPADRAKIITKPIGVKEAKSDLAVMLAGGDLPPIDPDEKPAEPKPNV